jgi:uncharacterized protein YjbI with pentapeptide repeats
MSDEQHETTQPDTREPDEERQAELDAAYERQKGSDSPYKGVKIQTLGELQWILRRRQWSVAFIVPEGMERANFREADFRFANLSGACFDYMDLSRARLLRANLCGSTFRQTKLGGSGLFEADLSGANLRGCYLDEQTNLNDIRISSQTMLGEIHWNGASILRVPWNTLQQHGFLRLGDEDRIPQPVTQRDDEGAIIKHRPKTRAESVQAIRDAARAYASVSQELYNQNLRGIAAQFRLREHRLERRALFKARKPGSLLAGMGSWLLDLVSGYGELPSRTFVAYVLVVLFFSLLDYLVTNTIRGSTTIVHLSWDESLVLSLTSFHGRGFFPGYLQLNDWVARIGAVEAVIGLFIELILIATFSRRFLGD